ncbi:uncharacterized protein LOC128128961 [Lactuca sativa]|uniref:uncharacterized protein LOC128128961 n=1 Tax=Lactuca sativa TaxID=4236 RepID=UPI0022AF3838|nr:uncharacterized protein LOC128128961 [Lactuca sativa]
MNALILQENLVEDEFSGVEIWSTESEDEEVRKPSHGSAYVVSEGVSSSAGKCLMVSAEIPTEGEDKEPDLNRDKCFAAKPVSKTINDCDRFIKKEDEVIDECESIMSSDEIQSQNTSEFDEESEMSEILVEDVIECSEFLKRETETESPLISEKYVEYARLSKDKSKKLKEKAVVYQKVQTVPNQVYVVKYETVGLSERTSCRVKGRYVAEPINKPSSFDKPSTSGTKEIPEEMGKKPEASNLSSKTTKAQKEKPKSSFNIHKSQQQLAKQKREISRRYMKNMNEPKQFWQSQNPNHVPTKKETNFKGNYKFKNNQQSKIRSDFQVKDVYQASGTAATQGEKAIHSEAKAADNKIDHLKKIIEEAAKDMVKDPSKPTVDRTSINPPNNSSIFEGECSSVSHTTEQEIPTPTEEENPTPTNGEDPEPEKEHTSPFEGENENSNGEDDRSELEEEVDAELDPVYDPNYPPMT